MSCPECANEMQAVNTNSNINTNRTDKGQRTGDIYWFEECEVHYLMNYLNGNRLEIWHY